MVSDEDVSRPTNGHFWVLILVLMEYGLGRCQREDVKNGGRVLILVLMEYGLGPQKFAFSNSQKHRLNPCFSGIWSRTRTLTPEEPSGNGVLILVLMEYGLGLRLAAGMKDLTLTVLILVLMEYGLGRVGI